MTDPVRIPGLFDVGIEPPFVRSREVEDLAGEVIAAFPEFAAIAQARAESGLSMAFVWETKPFDPARDEYRPHVIAKVTKAPPLWLSLTETHLVIQFRRWFWERFDDDQRRAVLHHELTHITVDEADDQGRIPLKLRDHDVEDFTATMRRFGPVIPGRREFVRAYTEWQAENPVALGDGRTADPETGEIHGRSHVEELAERVGRLPANEQAGVHAAVRGLRNLREMAERTGTTVTVSALGQSATFGPGAKADPDAHPLHAIVRDGESLDAARDRIERLDDFNRVIGSVAGQALMDAIRDEGGAFVPFPTAEQAGGAS